MREFWQLSLKLLLFSLVAGLLLALTNAVTEGPIAEQQEKTENASRYAVFASADSFEPVEDISSYTEQAPALTAVYKAMKGADVIGYTFNFAPSGYKSTIGMTVGVSAEGAITGVLIDSQGETQGVGSKITTDSFLSQFTGLAASAGEVESGVDTITGATISSSTVKKTVVSATALSENVLSIEPHASMPMDTADEYRLESLPGASGFDSVDLLSFLGDYSTIKGVKAAYSGADKIGYSFDLVAKGYGGDINMTLGISSADGTITGLTIGENSESEGYGKGIEKPEYYEQYAGLPMTDEALDGVDGVSGASVSSGAVIKAIKQAISFYNEYLNVSELPTLDSADTFTPITDRMAGSEAGYKLVKAVEQATAGGEVVGYRFTTSSFDGYNVDDAIKLQIDVAQGMIVNITVLSQKESEGIGSRAFEPDYLNQFIGTQVAPTDGIDTLAGATWSSGAIKKSIDQCAAFYAAYISGEVEAPQQEAAVDLPALDSATFADITDRMAGSEATYKLIKTVEEATADGEVTGYRFTTSSYDGYNADDAIKLQIDVAQGKIVNITVLSQKETDGVGSRAFEPDYLNQFIGMQVGPTDGIDTMSGATWSSGAIKKSIDQCAAFYAAYISGEEAAA